LAPLLPLVVSHDLGSVPARARIQMTVVSGVKITSRCACACRKPRPRHATRRYSLMCVTNVERSCM
jgi:hypothetical protein